MSLEGRLSGGSTISGGGLRSQTQRVIEIRRETYEPNKRVQPTLAGHKMKRIGVLTSVLLPSLALAGGD
jgi:hypothetical protein